MRVASLAGPWEDVMVELLGGAMVDCLAEKWAHERVGWTVAVSVAATVVQLDNR